MSIGRFNISSVVFLLTVALLLGHVAGAQAGQLKLDARSRQQIQGRDGQFRVTSEKLNWSASQTAIIICDVWDQHWCKGATRRGGELAPRINEVASEARDMGVLIIHAPSGTMDSYKDHPGRKIATDAPKAANLPKDIAKWCKWIDETEEAVGYPIDHSDGGCDCRPTCEQGSPWRGQIDTIEISDKDAVSDSGVEIWNLLEHSGIENVIIMGVHTNMCVLGRPFGLRNMARYGKNVVLMRDLTDTMYNSRMRPVVSHFTGTDLVVEHVEKYVCPTVTSTAFTGKPQFIFKNDHRPRVVFLSAESEYGAAESLPGFASELETKYGLSCEILQGSTAKKGEGRNYIPGMEALTQADLAVLFVRRRALPAADMKYFRDYMDRGGPLIGLRTASHAFDTRGKAPEGYSEWLELDGGNYHGHHGSGPTCIVTMAEKAKGHPVLAGVKLPFTSNGSLYEVHPLKRSAWQLLTGSIPGKDPEPVAWTNMYGKSRVFYTSLGHPDDFKNEHFRKLLINAAFWCMKTSIPRQ
ncbi:MAG: ThuA domain-containing protein [Planctomycetota bacterium]|jgi:type 1 glutamine amidotransferase/nicotinamidase-related amidase